MYRDPETINLELDNELREVLKKFDYEELGTCNDGIYRNIEFTKGEQL